RTVNAVDYARWPDSANEVRPGIVDCEIAGRIDREAGGLYERRAGGESTIAVEAEISIAGESGNHAACRKKTQAEVVPIGDQQAARRHGQIERAVQRGAERGTSVAREAGLGASVDRVD